MSPANRNSTLAFAAALIIVMIVLHMAYHGIPFDAQSVAFRTHIIAFDFNAYTIPFFILAGTLISWKRAALPALILAVFGLCFGVANALIPFYQIVDTLQHAPLPLRLIALSSTAFAIVALTLAISQPLRGKLDRLRFIACGIYTVIFVTHLFALLYPRWFFAMSLDIIRACLEITSFFLMAFLSWCIAFRHASPRVSQI